MLDAVVKAWVKVNTKHVIFPPQGKGEGEHAESSSVGEHQGSSSRTRQHHETTQPAPKRSGGRSHNTVTTVESSHDPETLAIRKFNNKRQTQRRRLERTRSQTDLLREMAKEELATSRSKSTKELERSRGKSTNDTVENERKARGALHGFFGGSHHQSPEKHEAFRPLTTGKYLNETMFVQQLEQQARARNTGGGASSAGGSSSKQRAEPSEPLHRRSIEIGDVGYEPNDQQQNDSGVARIHPSSPVRSRDEDVPRTTECSQCNEMETRLLSAYEDIRYLRDLALRNEVDDGSSTTRTKTSLLKGPNNELTNLADASKRLVEVTARHRRQIEQMTRETTRKQHDMHFKHSKISMICKELNEESSIRKQEALALEVEVRRLKAERDSLATEVQRLSAEATLYQQEQAEHELVRAKMTQYESGALDRADKAILDRDEIISDLSGRLERTMETLTIEREQQRQRRQIIFPSAIKNTQQQEQQHDVPGVESQDIAALQEELRIAKEAAKTSEALADAAKKEAAEKEAALLARCNELEAALAAKENG